MCPQRILYLDNDAKRRSHLVLSMVSCAGPCIDARARISKAELETGQYDYIFVHQGNEEESRALFKGLWDRHGAELILFSGGWPLEQFDQASNGAYRVSASMLQSSFAKVWERVEKK